MEKTCSGEKIAAVMDKICSCAFFFVECMEVYYCIFCSLGRISIIKTSKTQKAEIENFTQGQKVNTPDLFKFRNATLDDSDMFRLISLQTSVRGLKSLALEQLWH